MNLTRYCTANFFYILVEKQLPTKNLFSGPVTPLFAFQAKGFLWSIRTIGLVIESIRIAAIISTHP